jgi:hypothetical protein
MFRLLSKVFADTTMLYMPTNRAAPTIESCTQCGNHDNYPADRVISNQVDHSRPAAGMSSTRDIYILPSKQEVLFLFNTYFKNIGTLFPYINEADVLKEYQLGRMQQPPKFKAVFLALLNIIWAHACASLGKMQRETFYNKSVALLDLRTLERPGYELDRSTSYYLNLLFCTLSGLTFSNITRRSASPTVNGHVQAKPSEVNIQLYHACIMCQGRIPHWASVGENPGGL